MTLYDFWTQGQRWVIYNGKTCRLSSPNNNSNRAIVIPGGKWRKSLALWMLPWNTEAQPAPKDHKALDPLIRKERKP